MVSSMNDPSNRRPLDAAEAGDSTWLVPDYAQSSVIVEPPEDSAGNWAGAPSVALGEDGAVYLAYRLRRPIGEGRGFALVIARSTDTESFEEIARLDREGFDSDSLERPALVALPGGGWRLYVSCATPGTKHWRVDTVDAPVPDAFDAAQRRTVLPGDASEALKDPVVIWDGITWHLWVCAHPLDLPGEEDRMATRYATSDDGLTWTFHGTALAPRPGEWDARGARISCVLRSGDRTIAYYDGRASADDNGEECTGIALGTGPERFRANGGPLPGVPFASGSLRYLCAIEQPEGFRLYYETTRRNGAHDLRTEYVPRPRSPSQS
jgi:hypothetical protein